MENKKKIVRRLGDYDIWYQHCGNCGYDTGKSVKPEDGREKRCWKCGSQVYRDYSERALKKNKWKI